MQHNNDSGRRLHLRLLGTRNSASNTTVPHPGCCSDEDGRSPGGPRVCPPLAMARPYFPTLLVLLFLSSVSLLLLTLLPSVTPSTPLDSTKPQPPWPSCGLAQSWAVRIHAGLHQEEKEDEQGFVHLDVLADRVRSFSLLLLLLLCCPIIILSLKSVLSIPGGRAGGPAEPGPDRAAGGSLPDVLVRA